MFTKLFAIAVKEVRITFSSRSLILIMVAVPLAISSIVGLAFGGLGSGTSPVNHIPVAVVNHDAGSTFGVNYGQIYAGALVPPAEGSSAASSSAPACTAANSSGDTSSAPATNQLYELTDSVLFDAAAAQALVDSGDVAAPDAEAGSDAYVDAVVREAVVSGKYTAAIIIPADFSQKVSYIPVVHPQIEDTGVEIYANGGQPVAAGVIRSIADGITNQIATGNIAVAATFAQLTNDFGLAVMGQAAGSMDFGSAFACAFTPAFNTVGIDAQTVETPEARLSLGAQILVGVGASQALFFALFTAQFGVFSMYEERRNWTLQRMIVSPTPRWVILGGKLIGVFLTVIVQLLLLAIALSLVGSVMQGQLLLIWGTNLPLILLVMLAAAMAVSGLGMLLAGIARTPEQGQMFGSVINMGMAVLGGAFGFTLPAAVAQFSLVYWGSQAFQSLSNGGTDVWTAIIVMAGQGIILFLIGLAMFNRRFETV